MVSPPPKGVHYCNATVPGVFHSPIVVHRTDCTAVIPSSPSQIKEENRSISSPVNGFAGKGMQAHHFISSSHGFYLTKSNYTQPSLVRKTKITCQLHGLKSHTTSANSTEEDIKKEFEERKQKKKKKVSYVAGVEQDNIADPLALADHDSLFLHHRGVQIHYKIAEPLDEFEPNKVSRFPPILLLHGFAASLFSWSYSMKPLGKDVDSTVLAFDRPAFGLTSRVSSSVDDVNPYSLGFSVDITHRFIDHLGVSKAVLIAHSSGCLVAINAYLEAPDRVAALILVAPTIVAPLVFPRIFSKEIPLIRYMKRNIFKAMSMAFHSNLGIKTVRLLVDRFGKTAIRYAWHDTMKLTDHVVDGYTKPLRCKDWERALLDYTFASITESSSKPSSSSEEMLKPISCPVLVITGDADRVVPAWNAEILAKCIPRSRFETIKDCGHLPHEEKPQEFVALVENFLHSSAISNN